MPEIVTSITCTNKADEKCPTFLNAHSLHNTCTMCIDKLSMANEEYRAFLTAWLLH